MSGAFGYAVAILLAAAALRRLPVEVSRWRAQRRSRPLGRRGAAGPAGTGRRTGGRARLMLRRALDEAVVPCSESQAVVVWAAAAAVATFAGLVVASGAGAAA
ncbi:MAG: hypothetical protein OXG52_01295, partial [bacterium]|nr:hypothetical protein [bacterium]